MTAPKLIKKNAPKQKYEGGALCDELSMSYRRYAAECSEGTAGRKCATTPAKGPQTTGLEHGVQSLKGKVSRHGGKRKFVSAYRPPSVRQTEDKQAIRSETDALVAAYLSDGGGITKCK